MYMYIKHIHVVKPVYIGHSMEPENVPFMHNWLMGKMRQPFIDSDLLYRGAL
jgi:hypothetical protein